MPRSSFQIINSQKPVDGKQKTEVRNQGIEEYNYGESSRDMNTSH